MTGLVRHVNSDGIGILPDELMIYLFKFLPLESIVVCDHVCKRWRKLARDTTLWKNTVIVYSGKPGQSEVNKKNFDIILKYSDQISCLKLQYVYNYSEIKSILEKCKNLTSVELVMCRIGKEFEEDIKKWKNLKKLNLKNSILLVSNVELNIEYDQFKSLSYLALSDFGLSVTNCNTLLNCIHLSHIFIEKIRSLSIEYIRELILCKQKMLISFHIYGGESVDDKCLNLLSQCSSLKDLAIIRCEKLTDEGLIFLASLKRIEHLQIWNNSNFSEIALLCTLGSSNLMNLQSLSLSRISNISPVIVDVISEHYKNLKFLALYQCPKIIHTDYEKQLKAKFRNIDVVLY